MTLPRLEICALKCDLPDEYNPRNSDWIVIRDDDPDYARLAAMAPASVRPVRSLALYASATRYDFGGPL